MTLHIADIKEKEEYRSLLPPLQIEEYVRLREDIQQKGIQIPLIINSNKELLDGYTRLRIARELGIQNIPCIVKNATSELEEQAYILTINIQRRHLNIAQKAELALKLMEIEQERARIRSLLNLKYVKDMPTNNNDSNSNSNSITEFYRVEFGTLLDQQVNNDQNRSYNEGVREKVAKELNISNKIIEKVKKIKEYAKKDQEIAELWNEALQGQYNIKAVYNRVKEKEARDKIEPIVEEAKRRLEERFNNDNTSSSNTTTTTIANSSDSNNNKVKILYGDFREVTRDIPDNSIDLIFTDPPYDKDSIPLLRDLALLAVRVLKPSGFLAVMYGQNHIPEFFNAILSVPNLSYYWSIALHMPEAKDIFFEKNVHILWKPIFIFQKEPYIRVERVFKDYISEPKPDKSVHEWRQDIGSAIHVIKSFSREEDFILDPFAGTGTVIEASLILNRRIIAVEKDKEVYEFLVKRFT